MLLLAVMGPVAAAPAPTPSAGEFRAEQRWLRQHVLECNMESSRTGSVPPTMPSPAPGLDVLANNDPVIQNGRGPHRMKIGDQEYARGLYCHAVSRVEVRLPGPGRRFTAMVGLDHNEDTARTSTWILWLNGEPTTARSDGV